MALGGGLRCNDQRLGAMNHAPTKNYPCEPLSPPLGMYRQGTEVVADVAVTVVHERDDHEHRLLGYQPSQRILCLAKGVAGSA